MSNAYKDYKKIMPTVKLVLEQNELSRDDDNVLCTLVWEKQGMANRRSFKQFKEALAAKKIATPESISRSRRSLQEKIVSLRGKLYLARHRAEIDYINQLRLDL